MKRNKLEYPIILIIVGISITIALFNEHQLLHSTRSDLWIFVGVFFSFVALLLIRNIMKKNSDPYEIINPVLLGYTLYSLMLPLNYLVSLNVPTFEINIPGLAILPIYHYLVICTIGLIGLLAGYYLPFGRQLGRKFPVWSISNRELKITAGILMLYGLFSFTTNIAAYGGFANFIKVGYGAQRFVIQREATQFGSGMEIIGIASLIMMYLSLLEKKTIRVLLLILVLALIAYITLLIGQRRYIIYLLFMGFVIVNYRFLRLKLKWILLTVALVYAFFFVYPHTRKLWSQSGFTQGLTKTYEIAVKNPELLLPFASGEFLPPSKAVLEVITDNAFKFHYGSSYITGLITLIPRSGKVMPEILERLSTWRMKTYYPGLHERGVNFTFFAVGEGYANFGYLGAFLHMFMFGFITAVLYAYFRKNQNNALVLFIYAAFFALTPIESMHAEFTQSLWYLTHIYLGPFLLILGGVKFCDHIFSKRSS